MTVVEQLEQLKSRILTPNAWCKGQMTDFGESGGEPRHCLYGWIVELGAIDTISEIAAAILGKRVVSFDAYQESKTHILWFNDQPETTPESIASVIDKAVANCQT